MRTWPVNGRVTAHSVERYRRWTGHLCSATLAEERLKEIIMKGEKMLAAFPAIKLLNNNLEESEYYLFSGLVAVWRDNAVVTVVPFFSHEFYRETGRCPIPGRPDPDPKLVRRVRRERAVLDKKKFIFAKIKRTVAQRCTV